MELNTIQQKGKWSEISDTLNENFAKVNAETQRIELASRKNKGYFATASELTTKVPTALDGDIAYVGAKYPYNIYRWVDGAWVNSGEKGGEEVNNITNNVTNITGDVVNNPDDEDLVDNNGVLKLKDRDTSKGMGYVILRTDKTFAEQVTQPNTIYEIRYDFDLDGAEVEIPENCVLKFEGGKLSNGTLKGNRTKISNDKDMIFLNVEIEGTWCVYNIHSAWFDDIEELDKIKTLFKFCDTNIQNNVYISNGTYPVSVSANGAAAITIISNTNLYLDGTIALQPNSYYDYNVIKVADAQNVTIKGKGKVIGDKDEHNYIDTPNGSYDTHEWGRGVRVYNSANILIDGITSTQMTGDAFSLNGENIKVTNITATQSRRQGITVDNVKNLEISNFLVEDIKGTAPQAAIDIEPNSGYVQNVNISNGIMRRVYTGVSIYYPEQVEDYFNISINECLIETVTMGIAIAARDTSATKKLFVQITNCDIVGAREIGVSSTVKGSSLQISNTKIYTKENEDDVRVAFNIRQKSDFVVDNAYIVCHVLYGNNEDCNLTIRNSYIKSTIQPEETTRYPIQYGHFLFEKCTIDAIYFKFVSGSVLRDCILNISAFTIGTTSTDTYICTFERCVINIIEGSTSSYVFSIYTKAQFVDNIININRAVTFVFINYKDNNHVHLKRNIINDNGNIDTHIINNAFSIYEINTLGNVAGATEKRPTLKTSNGWMMYDEGYQYFDTTLKKPIWWNGKSWVDATGATV